MSLGWKWHHQLKPCQFVILQLSPVFQIKVGVEDVLYRSIITQCIYESLPLKKTFSTSKTFRLLQLFRKPLKWKNPMNASSQHKSVGGFLLPPIKEIKTSTSHEKEANKMINKQCRESPIGRLAVLGSISFNLKHNFFLLFFPILLKSRSGLRISN